MSENTTSTEIARRPDRTPLSQRDPVGLAQHFARSGYFQDAKDMSQAVVKIVAGEELGFGPMTAMAGIHIIEGKPSLSANLLATCVKRSEEYDYRVEEISAERCVITFTSGRAGFAQPHDIGTSKFTIEEAKQAGLIKDKSGWQKFPKAMLFARALSQGVRWFCPDVTAGSPAYVPEELGAEVDERGEVVVEPVESEVVEGEVIDSERAGELEKGIEFADLGFAELDLVLGAAGIDGLRAHSKKARRERLESLTPDQADALEAELHAYADQDGGEDA